MQGRQAQSRWLGVAVAISAERRGHLQCRSGTLAIEPGVSLVLGQFLIGRAPRSQLVTQLPRVLRALLPEIPRLLNGKIS